MRKLASIRRISDIIPIPNADAIECAVVDGWSVVIRKGEFRKGELAIYIEIDSWVPHCIAPFLTKTGKAPSVFNGVEGERLRTIKLRGQISQGLLLRGMYDGMQEGDEVTQELGIQKWERPLPPSLQGG